MDPNRGKSICFSLKTGRIKNIVAWLEGDEDQQLKVKLMVIAAAQQTI